MGNVEADEDMLKNVERDIADTEEETIASCGANIVSKVYTAPHNKKQYTICCGWGCKAADCDDDSTTELGGKTNTNCRPRHILYHTKRCKGNDAFNCILTYPDAIDNLLIQDTAGNTEEDMSKNVEEDIADTEEDTAAIQNTVGNVEEDMLKNVE